MEVNWVLRGFAANPSSQTRPVNLKRNLNACCQNGLARSSQIKGQQDVSLSGPRAKRGVPLRPQGSSKSKSSIQAKLNTATSVNAKRQHAFRAVRHLNQPSHALTFAKKPADTRITARIAFAFERVQPSSESIKSESIKLVCEFIFPATHSKSRIGRLCHIPPKTLGPYKANQRPGPKP